MKTAKNIIGLRLPSHCGQQASEAVERYFKQETKQREKKNKFNFLFWQTTDEYSKIKNNKKNRKIINDFNAQNDQKARYTQKEKKIVSQQTAI